MSEIVDKYHFIKHCEDIICSIKDVVSAKIVTTPDDKISEIHVIANSKRNPKQIVRDIESALIATLGSEVDHKKISVAQINDDNCYNKEVRLKIDGICLNKNRLSFEAMVTLSDPEGNSFEGKCVSTTSSGQRLKTVAMASIDALNKYLRDTVILSLEDMVTFRIGDREALSVMVAMVGRNEEHFIGCSLVNQDRAESVVAAVLNAVNRRISLWIKEKECAV